MATVMVVAPDEVREARLVLGLTQVQAGIAFGGVRPETISRWERSSRKKRPRIRPLHAEIMRQFAMAAGLLMELYPGIDSREAFLNSPQRELQGRTPVEAMLQDSPYGVRDVARLLGRMAEGIPT
jgi:uncharacterized protein (DUF2384 family)